MAYPWPWARWGIGCRDVRSQTSHFIGRPSRFPTPSPPIGWPNRFLIPFPIREKSIHLSLISMMDSTPCR